MICIIICTYIHNLYIYTHNLFFYWYIYIFLFVYTVCDMFLLWRLDIRTWGPPCLRNPVRQHRWRWPLDCNNWMPVTILDGLKWRSPTNLAFLVAGDTVDGWNSGTVVELPLFSTDFSTIPGGCLGLLPSTVCNVYQLCITGCPNPVTVGK